MIELENSQFSRGRGRQSGLTSFGSEVKRVEGRKGEVDRGWEMEDGTDALPYGHRRRRRVQLRLVWGGRSVTGLTGDAASFHTTSRG